MSHHILALVIAAVALFYAFEIVLLMFWGPFARWKEDRRLRGFKDDVFGGPR